MKHKVLVHTALVITIALWLTSTCIAEEVKTGNVIFIHPDGAGLNSWNACRIIKVGPDGEIAWDRLSHIGIYRGHMKDGLTATSHGGATTHAYGVKVPADSYGMHAKKPLKALSGFSGSIMQEAQKVGKAVGIVNSGNIGEPGTGVFLASSPSRQEIEKIAEQVLTSGAQVIMSGGEKYLLPDRKQGFHGKGVRKDGRNLIERAKLDGYTVVYTRKQLEKLDLEEVEKLLGIFAANDTYNDLTEEQLDAANLPLYAPEAPTFSQMVSAALKVLSKHPEGFLLVAEEEGSDNFGNANNAYGVLDALQRADAAYEVVLKFIERNANTLLVTTSDSDAGGLQVVCPALSSGEQFRQDKPLPGRMKNGAPLDGKEGTLSTPFISAPDQNGKGYTFGITFAAYSDVAGGVLARAAGLNSDKLPLNVDNTDIYRLMYLTLFGKNLGLDKKRGIVRPGPEICLMVD